LRTRIGDARSARLRLTIDVAPTLCAEIDRGLFGQALSNLLQNAVESYAPEGNEPIAVHLVGGARSAGTLVTLAVEDRGRGMPPEMRERVGEAFVSSKGSGRGLGMLDVRRMIETAHGGEVEVKSEAGRGTRVTMVVPRRQ
jgi:signal transduction histidine kinase